MDYGKNIKYFQSSDKLFYIGLALLIPGAILFGLTLFWFWFIPYQNIIGIALAVIGASLAFIPRSLRSNEKDIDAIVNGMTEGYAKEVTEKLGLEKQIVKTMEQVSLGNYIYEGEELLLRRGKDDRKCRTSKYSIAAVLCTKNGIILSHKTCSLIDETVTETIHEFLYTEMDAVSIIDNEIKLPDGTKTKDTRFVITKDGKELLNLPTVHVIAVDRLAADINRMIPKT